MNDTTWLTSLALDRLTPGYRPKPPAKRRVPREEITSDTVEEWITKHPRPVHPLPSPR